MSSIKKLSVNNIIIMGGGRWARVIIKVLYDILDPTVNISIYTPNNHLNINKWIVKNKVGRQIKVITSFPNSFNYPTVVIIANTAADHYKSALLAISAGADVLVEKPVALNYKQASDIYDFAKKNNKIVCASHVFLFASYIENFSKHIQEQGQIEKIKISWEDSDIERRHGELKKYDSGLPILVDCLPHIFSIISKFTPIDISCNSIKLKIFNGGSKVNIFLENSGIPIEILMVRRGLIRTRLVETIVKGKNNTLDFSNEPGVIKSENKKMSGDLTWDYKSKPLNQLLSAFLSGAYDRQFDKRLDFQFGVQVSKLIDKSLEIYKNLQLKWVINKIKSEDCLNQDLAYAINELNLSNGLNINIKLDDNKFNNDVKKSLLFEFNKLLIENKDLIK